ncbi:Amine oxidase [Fusarium keratoplasticum]|nr:Amine oxidase [Fusarium keratoplasticum]
MMNFKTLLLSSLPLTSSVLAAKHGYVDVAVVGGGLSGLAAAKDLAAAGKSFVVIEARDRVGGRVLNAHLPNGGVEELGAEFIGPTQDRVIDLASSLGLEMYSTYATGNSTLFYQKTKQTYSADTGGLPPADLESLSELQSFIREVDKMAGQLDVDSPWSHPEAKTWDGLTLESFVKQKVTRPESRFLVENAVASILSTELKEPSLLYFLAYVAAAGNETTPGALGRLVGVHGGAQDSRVNGGTQLLATKLADGLGWDHVKLRSPVRKIIRQGNRYLVVSDRWSVVCNHVVVAMSPPMAKAIAFEPALPAGRVKLNDRMTMGAIGKAIAIYPKPWWRGLGLNGQVLSDSGVIRTTFDNSPADASYGAIMGFIEADEMRKLDTLSEKEVQDLVVNDLVKYFGSQAGQPSGFLLQRWDLEEYSKGGPVAYAPPGILSSAGRYLRARSGNIHFAGTETANYWTGYMDGAIRSGERVAKEILA